MRFLLKPCPFCGNAEPSLFNLGPEGGDDWGVECSECTAQMTLVDTQAQAVNNWNRRVPAAVVTAGQSEKP